MVPAPVASMIAVVTPAVLVVVIIVVVALVVAGRLARGSSNRGSGCYLTTTQGWVPGPTLGTLRGRRVRGRRVARDAAALLFAPVVTGWWAVGVFGRRRRGRRSSFCQAAIFVCPPDKQMISTRGVKKTVIERTKIHRSCNS